MFSFALVIELGSGFIRNGALGPIKEWKLKECIAVHKLLETVLIDHAAASSKRTRSLPIHVFDLIVIVCTIKVLNEFMLLAINLTKQYVVAYWHVYKR